MGWNLKNKYNGCFHVYCTHGGGSALRIWLHFALGLALHWSLVQIGSRDRARPVKVACPRIENVTRLRLAA